MDPIIIEKNIPIPAKNKRASRTSLKYEFLKKMSIGDSVELTVLKAPYKHGNTNRNDILTYYGLMNAIHKTQKESNLNAGYPQERKKFTVRTIRLEDSTRGMLRVLRVWRKP